MEKSVNTAVPKMDNTAQITLTIVARFTHCGIVAHFTHCGIVARIVARFTHCGIVARIVARFTWHASATLTDEKYRFQSSETMGRIIRTNLS